MSRGPRSAVATPTMAQAIKPELFTGAQSGQLAQPRRFLDTGHGLGILPGPGLPQDRHARIAARRIFVALKQRFMLAVNTLDGLRHDWLRRQVRQVQEPGDLWLLRGAVFDALGLDDPTSQRQRHELQALLDQIFPDQGELRPLPSLA